MAEQHKANKVVFAIVTSTLLFFDWNALTNRLQVNFSASWKLFAAGINPYNESNIHNCNFEKTYLRSLLSQELLNALQVEDNHFENFNANNESQQSLVSYKFAKQLGLLTQDKDEFESDKDILLPLPPLLLPLLLPLPPPLLPWVKKEEDES